MQIQPPAGGDSPLPAEYNDLSADRLLDGRIVFLHASNPQSSAIQLNETQCSRCRSVFPETGDYNFRDSFYCDDCTWALADRGEFYCG
jgi:hypothetical protein